MPNKKLLLVLKQAKDIDSYSKNRQKLDQMLAAAGIPEKDYRLCTINTFEKYNGTANTVVPMGADAFHHVMGEEQSIMLKRGEFLYSEPYNSKVLPTFHPGFIHQNWANQETIEYDLRKAYKYADTPELPETLGEDYSVVTTVEDARAAAEYLKSCPAIAFDIETEGFDTFDKDEILCVQFSGRAGEGIVFPLRGAWLRHEEDVYSEHQLETGFWRFIEVDGVTSKVLCRNAENKPRPLKPAFPKGSVVCREAELHKTSAKPKGHNCRGYLTDVLGGEQVTYKAEGRMRGKKVPADYMIFREIIEEIMQSSAIKIAHNGKFDVHGLEWQLGIQTRRFLFDTMLAYHNFHEERPHNLEFVRSRYTPIRKYDLELKTYVGKGKKNSYAMVPNEVLWLYGAADADVEFRLMEPLLEELRNDNEEGEWLFNNIDMPYNRALIQIENNGMLVDQSRFDVLVAHYKKTIIELRGQIAAICVEHGIEPLKKYNNSHTLRTFLYDALDLPTDVVPVSEKTGLPSTGKKAFVALQKWCNEKFRYKTTIGWSGKKIRVATNKVLSERQIRRRAWISELLTCITHYKKAVQAKNLFLNGDEEKQTDGLKGMLQHIRYDGKIHSTYMQLAKTNRITSSKPNLQNLAGEDEFFEGYGIRTMVYAPKGEYFLEADYDSQEIRGLAYIANEKNLMDVLMTCECGINFSATPEDPVKPWAYKPHREATGHEAANIHRATAAKVFKKLESEVTDQERTFAKRITFGLNYGQGAFGLSEILGIPFDEAEVMVKDYFIAFPKLRRFHDRTRAKVMRGENLVNAYGRYRHNYGVVQNRNFASQDNYRMVTSAMYREGVNYPVQATPADIMGNVAPALADVWGCEYEDWQAVESLSIAYDLMGGQHPSLMLRDLDVKVVNLVHDSVQMTVPKQHVNEVSEIVTTVMERLPWQQLEMYFPVDIKYGTYWGEKKVAA